jgi:hypothetical protein
MNGCLTPERVHALLGGRLTPTEVDASHRHADECPSCRQLLATASSPHDEPAPPGDELPFRGTDRFAVIRCLGAGGMGKVYEVDDRQLGARVALKTLRRFSGPMLLRLKHEFRALADLHQRNLVSLGELIHDDGQWFFTMELVCGRDFLRHVRPDDQLDQARLRAALAEIADGLDALHRAGKVHRDLKPSNVLVEDGGRVVLLDFGLVDDADRGALDLVAGTPEYMAPEQARGRRVDAAADWYAVGVMLYQALTGQLPIEGNRQALLKRKQLFEPHPPSAHAPLVPDDLDSLCRDLLRIDARARPGAADVRARLGRAHAPIRAGDVDAPPFVGRRAELAQLHQALAASRHAAVAVLVAGESGVGKSALVRRFADEAAAAGALVLAGRCYERESVPYKGVDGVVDALGRWLIALPPEQLAPLLPDDAALLPEAFPVLSSLRAGFVAGAAASDGPREPAERRQRLFAALRALLAAVAARSGPVILQIDDLQWSDDDSLALLGELLRAPSLLLVATLRPDTTLALDCELRTLPLMPLGRDDARALAAALVADADAAASVAVEAAGHPLFIAELARQARAHARGALTLDDALRRRTLDLDEPARALLELTAIAGAPLLPELLARAAAAPPDRFARHLHELRAAHFVHTSGGRVDTYHDRVRAAVLAGLDEHSRRDRHRRLAEALEANGRADAEALLLHWRGAGEPARAAGHAVAAAKQARAALAFERAAQLYRTALALDPDRADATQLQIQLSETLIDAGRQLEAADSFLAAVLSSGSDGSGVALDLRRRAAERLLFGGRTAEGLALLDEVLAAIGLRRARGAARSLLTLVWLRARLRLGGLGGRTGRPHELTPATRARLDVLFSASVGLFASDLLGGFAFHTRYLLAALAAGEPHHLARAMANEVVFATLSGQPHRRRHARLAARAQKLAAGVDEPLAQARLVLVQGISATVQGRFADGQRHLDEGERILRDRCTGAVHELNLVKLFGFIAMHFRGQLAPARALAEQWLREAIGRGELFGAVAWRIGLTAGARLGGGDVAGARRHLEVAGELAARAPSGYAFTNQLLAATTLDLYDDDRAAAWRRLRPTWRALAASQALRQQWLRIFFWDLRGRAALAAATAHKEATRGRMIAEAVRAARRIERERVAWARPLATLLRAGAAAVRGDGDGAARHYDAAAHGFLAHDMAMHRAVALRRRGELDGRGDGGADWFTAHAVHDPDRFTRAYAPAAP